MVDEERTKLLEAARAGDVEALGALVRAHRSRVLRFALRACMTYEDAEDATQETLLALSRYVHALRGAAALTAWLFTVVKNRCKRYVRRRLRLVLDTQDGELLEAETVHAPEASWMGEPLQAQVVEALGRLLPIHREVLLLRDVEGLTAAETAERLGLTVMAVKSRLHRARAALREQLLASSEPD